MFGLGHEIDEMKHLFGLVNPLVLQGCDIILNYISTMHTYMMIYSFLAYALPLFVGDYLGFADTPT